MTIRNPRRDRTVRDQAAEFIVSDADGASPDDRQLQRWLAESPRNVEEKLRMQALWEALGDPALASDLYDPAQRGRRLVPRRLWLAAAALVLIGLSIGVWLAMARPRVYRTAVGEVMSFQLEDRTVVFLNADSELSIRYSRAAREVELRSGEAAFDVAANPQLPFIVDCGSTRVVAIGTEFVVRRTQGETTVTVIEGHVRVESQQLTSAVLEAKTSARIPPASPPAQAGAAEPQVTLGPQQRLTMRPRGEPEMENLAPHDEPAAWRQRRLVFNGARLEDVVAEFNRFNVDTIRIDAPALRELRIGGVFDANDPASLIAFLGRHEGVAVTTTADGTVVVSASE